MSSPPPPLSPSSSVGSGHLATASAAAAGGGHANGSATDTHTHNHLPPQLAAPPPARRSKRSHVALVSASLDQLQQQQQQQHAAATPTNAATTPSEETEEVDYVPADATAHLNSDDDVSEPLSPNAAEEGHSDDDLNDLQHEAEEDLDALRARLQQQEEEYNKRQKLSHEPQPDASEQQHAVQPASTVVEPIIPPLTYQPTHTPSAATLTPAHATTAVTPTSQPQTEHADLLPPLHTDDSYQQHQIDGLLHPSVHHAQLHVQATEAHSPSMHAQHTLQALQHHHHHAQLPPLITHNAYDTSPLHPFHHQPLQPLPLHYEPPPAVDDQQHDDTFGFPPFNQQTTPLPHPVPEGYKPFQYKSSRVGDRYQATVPELQTDHEGNELRPADGGYEQQQNGSADSNDASFPEGEPLQLDYLPQPRPVLPPGQQLPIRRYYGLDEADYQHLLPRNDYYADMDDDDEESDDADYDPLQPNAERMPRGQRDEYGRLLINSSLPAPHLQELASLLQYKRPLQQLHHSLNAEHSQTRMRVCIIGATFSGLIAAEYLQQFGFSITILGAGFHDHDMTDDLQQNMNDATQLASLCYKYGVTCSHPDATHSSSPEPTASPSQQLYKQLQLALDSHIRPMTVRKIVQTTKQVSVHGSTEPVEHFDYCLHARPADPQLPVITERSTAVGVGSAYVKKEDDGALTQYVQNRIFTAPLSDSAVANYCAAITAARQLIDTIIFRYLTPLRFDDIANNHVTQIEASTVANRNLLHHCDLCYRSPHSTQHSIVFHSPLLGPFQAVTGQSTTDDIYVHQICARMSAEVLEVPHDKTTAGNQPDGAAASSNADYYNIGRTVSKSHYIQCSLPTCMQTGATITCQAEDCLRAYHTGCALQTGCNVTQPDCGSWFLCQQHRTQLTMHSVTVKQEAASNGSNSGQLAVVESVATTAAS